MSYRDEKAGDRRYRARSPQQGYDQGRDRRPDNRQYDRPSIRDGDDRERGREDGRDGNRRGFDGGRPGDASRGRGDRNGRGDSRGGNFGGRGGRGGGSRGGGPRIFISGRTPLPAQVSVPASGTPLVYAAFNQQSTRPPSQRFTASVNHFEVQSVTKGDAWVYSLQFRVPESSQLRGSAKVTLQQMARLIINTEFLSILGTHFYFDGTSRGFSFRDIMPSHKEGSQAVLQTTLSFGKRKDGGDNEIELQVQRIAKVPLAALKDYCRGGSFGRDPMGNIQIADALNFLQTAFQAEPNKAFVRKPNMNSYYHRVVPDTVEVVGILEAIRGFTMSLQLRFGRLTLGINTAASLFWPPDVSILRLAARLINQPESQLESAIGNNSQRFFQACGSLLGVFFCVKHLPRADKRFRFKAWSNRDAFKTVFDREDSSISVYDYYQEKYNIKLKYPTLPLASTREGDFPLELCFTAPNERYKGDITPEMTAGMLSFASLLPGPRTQQIEEFMKILAFHEDKSLLAHGLTVKPRMMEVEGLMVSPPNLRYGNEVSKEPQNGRWDLRNVRLAHPPTIKSWILIHFGVTSNDAACFATAFCNCMHEMGMTVPHKLLTVQGNPQGDIALVIQEALNRAEVAYGSVPTALVFLCEDDNPALHKSIKLASTCRFGVTSVVMLASKAMKMQKQYLCNIGLKLCGRMSGKTHIVQEKFFACNAMLIGADTSIPLGSRLDANQMSISAVSATMDIECSVYSAVCRLQDNKHTIDNIKEMFIELFQARKALIGKHPKHVIFFRDGVSESEFEQIRAKEGLPLREICKELGAYITLIVAIKRHSTYFSKPSNGESKLGNVRPGAAFQNSSTINDCFFGAHPDLVSTKRHTRYVTLVDENKLTYDQFVNLLNSSSFSYNYATTATSLVAPVFHADRAAKYALEHVTQNADGSSTLHQVHKNLRTSQWW